MPLDLQPSVSWDQFDLACFRLAAALESTLLSCRSERAEREIRKALGVPLGGHQDSWRENTTAVIRQLRNDWSGTGYDACAEAHKGNHLALRQARWDVYYTLAVGDLAFLGQSKERWLHFASVMVNP